MYSGGIVLLPCIITPEHGKGFRPLLLCLLKFDTVDPKFSEQMVSYLYLVGSWIDGELDDCWVYGKKKTLCYMD